MGRHKGQRLSDEHKQKIRESLNGRRLSDQHRERIAAALRGKERSEEHRQHLSESLRKTYQITPSLHKAEDLTGCIFGHWVVLERANKPTKAAMWVCKCDCGTEQVVSGYHLRHGESKNWGCRRNEAKELPKGVAGGNRVLSGYKRGAKKRNLSWELTNEQFFQLTQQNCHYCGLPPAMEMKSSPTSRTGVFVYNGVDRKDSSLGYTSDNVVPCCKECQKAKSNTPYDVFIAFINRAGNFQKGARAHA
jgi:hypothetical protein